MIFFFSKNYYAITGEVKKLNEKSKIQASAETLSFDDGENEVKKSSLEKLRAYLKKKLFALRHAFADRCDKSYLSNQFDNLYFSILNCQVSIFGTFMIVMSIISLALSYLIDSDLSSFLTNTNVYTTIVICVIGFAFLACRKTIGETLSQSSLFSHLDIVYSQPAIIADANAKRTIIENTSTAFFVGAIAGIISIIFPSISVLLFILAICYFIFVLARPECGLLFFLFTIPFFTAYVSSFISIITFLALLYKYLRGKRHIDFKLMEATLIFTVIYIVLRCSFTGLTSDKIPVLTEYIAFFLMFITVISLVRTTSMLRRSISVIIAISRVYALLCVIFYVCFIFLGRGMAIQYFEALGLYGLVSAMTSRSFIVSFLSIMAPLTFANIFIKNSKAVLKNFIYFIIYIAMSSFVDSFMFTLILIVFSLLTFLPERRKIGFIILLSPAIAYGIFKLFDMIPASFRFIADGVECVTINSYFEMLKGSLIFGSGIANQIGVQSGVLSLIYVLGIVGTAILSALICIIIHKAKKSVSLIKEKNIKISTYSHGLLSSAFSFIATTFFFNTLMDFRPVLLFAAILSLAFTGGRCFDEDYVDPNMLREQTIHN